MEDAESHVRLKVRGRVQGVFYRQSTRDRAKQLGLRGWVRNENDGSVLVEAHGNKENVQVLIDWCHHGPPSAKVSEVEVEWLDSFESPADFHIR